jgi:pyruvate/2-oxoglutarate/acetoin dehydrogenase E1 component
MDAILGSLRKTMRLAVAHDAHRTLGFGAEIAARCMEEAFDYLDAPVERVAGADVPIPCTPSGIEAVYPGADDIVAAVRRLLS